MCIEVINDGKIGIMEAGNRSWREKRRRTKYVRICVNIEYSSITFIYHDRKYYRINVKYIRTNRLSDVFD